jgi:ABC-type antimicrobial peptide transport system ATPase subunit
MAREGKAVAGPWDKGFGQDWEAEIKAHEDALAELMKVSNALPEGEVKGYVYYESVADGRAYYLVESVVRHIPFLDAWRISPNAIRGLNVSDLKAAQKTSKLFAKLFGGSGKAEV